MSARQHAPKQRVFGLGHKKVQATRRRTLDKWNMDLGSKRGLKILVIAALRPTQLNEGQAVDPPVSS